MIPTDRCYFERRAEAELHLAQQATHPAVVKAHYELAEHYLERMERNPGGGTPPVGPTNGQE